MISSLSTKELQPRNSLVQHWSLHHRASKKVVKKGPYERTKLYNMLTWTYCQNSLMLALWCNFISVYQKAPSKELFSTGTKVVKNAIWIHSITKYGCMNSLSYQLKLTLWCNFHLGLPKSSIHGTLLCKEESCIVRLVRKWLRKVHWNAQNYIICFHEIIAEPLQY